ncbi:hypothetical protein P7C70_g2406, partial [Phenoliferia sp. Uapishka_3]
MPFLLPPSRALAKTHLERRSRTAGTRVDNAACASASSQDGDVGDKPSEGSQFSKLRYCTNYDSAPSLSRYSFSTTSTTLSSLDSLGPRYHLSSSRHSSVSDYEPDSKMTRNRLNFEEELAFRNALYTSERPGTLLRSGWSAYSTPDGQPGLTTTESLADDTAGTGSPLKLSDFPSHFPLFKLGEAKRSKRDTLKLTDFPSYFPPFAKIHPASIEPSSYCKQRPTLARLPKLSTHLSPPEHNGTIIHHSVPCSPLLWLDDASIVSSVLDSPRYDFRAELELERSKPNKVPSIMSIGAASSLGGDELSECFVVRSKAEAPFPLYNVFVCAVTSLAPACKDSARRRSARF